MTNSRYLFDVLRPDKSVVFFLDPDVIPLVSLAVLDGVAYIDLVSGGQSGI